MDMLKDTLHKVISGYAGKALNGYSYLTVSSTQDLFTIVSIGMVGSKRIVNTGLVARIVDDKIVIEHDINDKMLVDALLQAGIPRNQIVLAYAGEGEFANQP